MKKIFITGYTGFLGTNLINALNNLKEDYQIYGINSQTSIDKIDEYTKDCDFVFNLAAVHRPRDDKEFEVVNAELFSYIIKNLEKNNNNCPVLYTSSIQAKEGNQYGESKLHGERILEKHVCKCKSRGIVYRLTNTFGPHARPNGHSVVATFCNNIAKGIPIYISDANRVIHLQYVEDVIDEFLKKIYESKSGGYELCEVPSFYIYDVTLEQLANYIYSFEDKLQIGKLPVCSTEFERKLLKTYLYYRRKCETK